MKPRNKGKLPVFVPLFKDTMNALAWRAASHGARSLFTALKSRYNRTLCGAVYLSTRMASKELGSHKDRITRWFRELEYYGFIVMVSPGCLGVYGKGKAPHWRLTDEWYHDEPPTRDFHRWDGTVFHEQKRPKSYLRKKQNPVPKIRDTVSLKTGTPASLKTGTPTARTVPKKRDIAVEEPVPKNGDISSSTIPMLEKSSGDQSCEGQVRAGVLLQIPDDLSIPEFLRIAPSSV
ncbi:MAG: hypothetical protein WAK55_30295 [Xanthobacteraceae bacterium]